MVGYCFNAIDSYMVLMNCGPVLDDTPHGILSLLLLVLLLPTCYAMNLDLSTVTYG